MRTLDLAIDSDEPKEAAESFTTSFHLSFSNVWANEAAIPIEAGVYSTIVEKKSMGGEPGSRPLVRPPRQFKTLKTS